MEILTQAISQSGISRFSLVNNVLESNYRSKFIFSIKIMSTVTLNRMLNALED